MSNPTNASECMRRVLFPLIVLAALAIHPWTAFGDDNACSESPAAEEIPSDADVQRRLQWLETRVADIESDVQLWFMGFGILHAALTSINFAIAVGISDDQERIDYIVNGTGGVLGLATLLISTPPIIGASTMIRSLPRTTPDERLAAMRLVEARLRQSAESSEFVRSPLASLLSAGVVEAGALTLLFFDRPIAALLLAGGGTVVGQGQILLHPTGAIDAWRMYLRRYPDAGCIPEGTAVRLDSSVRFAISPAALDRGSAGIAFTLSF
jgi:hypothetical protein